MHIAVIGNGISGITAARTIRKSDPSCRITVISSESVYFYSRTALMYIYMGHMTYEHTKPYEDHFWKDNRIDLIFDRVNKIDFQNRKLKLEKHSDVDWDKLLLATGSRTNKFAWPGQDLKGVQGLYSLQDLELLEKNTHRAFTSESEQKVRQAVIVGGGLIGVELAEMLMSRNIAVTFLVRENGFWGNVLPKEESDFISEHLKSHHIQFHFNTELKEILSDSNGRVKSVVTSAGTLLECQFVGLTTGVTPNIDFLRESELETDRGILVNRNLQTNLKDVYAAGDCVQFREAPEERSAIEQVWYTGRMMGEVAGQNLTGKIVEYNPGPWFNSAKFFDIEFQTYGKVQIKKSEDLSDFFWLSDKNQKCLRLQMQRNSRILKGLNVFGIRLRHELMHRWIEEKRTADYFLQHWNQVSFEPEFSKNVLPEIISLFNKQFETEIIIPKKTWLEYLIKN